jgi:hypothetical protein
VSKRRRLLPRVLFDLPSPFTFVRSSHLPAVSAGKHTYLILLLVRVVAVIAVGAVLIGVVILRDSCRIHLEALQLVPIKHYGRDPILES